MDEASEPSQEHAAARVVAPSARHFSTELRVVGASALLLFAELLVVRHCGAELARLAFFKNLVLIAAFLGGGLGMAVGERRAWPIRLVVPFLVLFAVGVPWVGQSEILEALRFGGVDEFSWSLAHGTDVLDSSAFLLFFLTVFTAALLLFVGLGALVGAAVARLPPLRAYALNLAGSIVGVLAFAAISVLGTGPGVWYGLLALTLPLLVARDRKRQLLIAATLGLAALTSASLSRGALWSPYSRLEVRARSTSGPTYAELSVNRAYFMSIADLSVSSRVPRLAGARRHYDLPYQFVTPAPERVLVLGAGGGNDVAAALRAGALEVDAVEIDPAIIHIGRELHGEHPYDSPRVHVHVDDARSFLAHTKQRYDLVTLGLLDSHAVLAGLPGVRLDNYVYTVESMAAARKLLKPDGVLSLSFAVPEGRPWIELKLERMLEAAFGEVPQMYAIGYDVSVAYLVGPGLASPRARAAASILTGQKVDLAAVEAAIAGKTVSVPTDDWPHLYIRARGVPRAQLLLLGLLLLASLAATLLLAPVAGRPDVHFALLGAGFLLVETKGIADLGLLFGGTWWTVTAVVLAVLVMALLSTGLVARFRPQGVRLAYVALLASLALSWLVRPSDLLGLPLGMARCLGALLVALPVLFSGVVFAVALSGTRSVAAALGSNLLGAVAGGFLEYASLAVGVRALGLIAIAVYGLAALSAMRGAARGSSGPAT